jgi:hypothetical protein
MANRFLVSGGNGDFDSSTNWSTTSGGVSGASFPTLVDDIIIDANSLNAPITVNVLSACKSFTASNYTGTWNIANDFSVNGTTNTGNITLSAGMTITGIGSFIKVPTGTTGVITSNGVVFDCNFIFQAAAATTTTITGAMQVNKNLTFSLNSTAINTINSGTISVGGDIIHNSPVAGTSVLQMIGSTTATITQVATRFLQNNLIINKSGIWNQVDLYWGASSRTLTYTSAVVNHTGILFVGNGGILNTSGMTWNTIDPSTGLNFTSICNANKLQKTANTININLGGTFGFNINYLDLITSNTGNISFSSGKTYTINTSLIYTAVSKNAQFRCNSGANAIINLGANAFMKIYKVNILRITASNKTLRIVDGTVDSGVSQNVFVLDSNINPYSKTI